MSLAKKSSFNAENNFLWFEDWAGKFSSPGLSNRPKTTSIASDPLDEKKFATTYEIILFFVFVRDSPKKFATMETQIKAGADFDFLMRALK